MGPLLNLVKTVFPNLVGHHEDVLAVAVIKKYQKMALRGSDELATAQTYEKVGTNSPGRKTKNSNISPHMAHSKSLNNA